VREVVGRAVQVFERDLGCIVEEAHPGWEDPFGHFFTLMLMETDLKGMRRLIRQYGAR
jgi:aspartyl-tRNA(Asn)/glutamyl-tRNA(Gln) amidotransferase subunit A